MTSAEISRMRKWPPITKVAVNLSPVQFQTPNLTSNIARILTATKLSPERLELEITESVLLQHSEKNISVLHELRELGVSAVETLAHRSAGPCKAYEVRSPDGSSTGSSFSGKGKALDSSPRCM